MYKIYGVLNTKSKKFYIGKTKNSLSKRKNSHKYQAFRKKYPHKFYDCLLYHEEDLFWFIIEDNIDENLINDKEKYYIKLYDSFENGYNGTLGGDGGNTWFGDSVDIRRKEASKRILGKNNHNYGKKCQNQLRKK